MPAKLHFQVQYCLQEEDVKESEQGEVLQQSNKLIKHVSNAACTKSIQHSRK